jgi:hypothetical protein
MRQQDSIILGQRCSTKFIMDLNSGHRNGVIKFDPVLNHAPLNTIVDYFTQNKIQ